MRLTPILLLTSYSLFACQAAATASELATVRHTIRGHPVTTKLHQAVREEERSPSLLGAEEHDVLQKLRSLVGEANLPSIPAGGIQESQDSAYARGLLALYSKLEDEFGERLDSVLALADKQFDGEEDKPLRELVADLLSRKNDPKFVETSKKRVRADDSEGTRLHTLKKPVVYDPHLTVHEQKLLDKLRSVVQPFLPWKPSDDMEFITKQIALNIELGKFDEVDSALKLAKKHFPNSGEDELLKPINDYMTLFKSFKEGMLDLVKKEMLEHVSKDTRKGK